MEILQSIINILPAVISGMVLWYLKKYFNDRDKRTEKKEQERIEYEVLSLKAVSASLAVGEATAASLEKGKFNGEVTKARQYAAEVNTEINDYMFRKGLEKII